MKIRDLIDRVNVIFNKDVPEYNKIFSNREIYNKLMSVRSRLLIQKVDRYGHVGHWSYQSLELPLTLINTDNTRFSSKVLRSGMIPEILIARNDYLILNVSNLNKTINFPYLNFTMLPYLKDIKYINSAIHFTIEGNYLYIINSLNLQSVILNAVFSNPLDIPSTLPYLDREFPIDNDLIDSLVQLTLEELYPALKKPKE